MMLPTRVLPSNAPPLQDGDGLHYASRILQEHSGNRQHNDFSYPLDYEQKYPSSVLNENTYARQHQPQQQHVPHELFQQRPQQRRAWLPNFGRGVYADFTPEDIARNRAEADYLYTRFRQSESYVKYRNRQSKDDKGNEDQKWPDHLEKAFFQALVTWKPMGRRKYMLKDKQRGRNELIADCIQHLTGEARTRKQVSSHIQVLKPFVERDPYIMKFLSKEDLCASHGKHGNLAGWGGGRRASNYPVISAPNAVRSTMAALQKTNMCNISKLKHQPDVFEPVEFEMFVQQTYKNASGHHEAEPRRLHTYTHHVEEPRKADLYLNDWATINRDFPLLGAMSSQGKLDCNVIVAEASLAFPTETFKGRDGSTIPGIELGISLLCSSRHLPFTPKAMPSQVHCLNTFYENGAIKTYVENGAVKEERQESEVRLENSERPNCHGSLDTQIKFGSTFWARTLGQLANRLLNTTKDYREEVAQLIRNTAVVQEIFFVSADRIYERLAVIHWSFRQSTHSNGAGGVTSWRRLVLPPLTIQDSQHGTGIQQDDFAKAERQDSFFDCYSQNIDFWGTQPLQHQPLPALQSPFEYDSGSGSALSSATWPASVSDSGVAGQQLGNLGFAADNVFDFNAGNIHIAYDHGINFDNFDSSAFDFDTTVDFAADPALEAYSQPWTDPARNTSFDSQPNHVVEDSSFTTAQQPDFSHQVYADDYASQNSQHSYPGLPEQHPYDTNVAAAAHDQQAYGGAGQETAKEEDALAALADVSYLASAFEQKPAASSSFEDLDSAYDIMQAR